MSVFLFNVIAEQMTALGPRSDTAMQLNTQLNTDQVLTNSAMSKVY